MKQEHQSPGSDTVLVLVSLCSGDANAALHQRKAKEWCFTIVRGVILAAPPASVAALERADQMGPSLSLSVLMCLSELCKKLLWGQKQ